MQVKSSTSVDYACLALARWVALARVSEHGRHDDGAEGLCEIFGL